MPLAMIYLSIDLHQLVLTSSISVHAGECIDAVSGELTFFTLPNCFELFGFDLMVDDQWRVWLLEVCRTAIS